ncbi:MULTISPECIES: 5-guanidino-2-oxopentanoate decarboxylase [unclassified Crossiella]|uniref:5-guanidino-2-oxopentanoate decarboxylase n=1 Tax=unclassified Crossiella TaxID=2620835 RepID=UPI001FFFC39F|nr:MULTISPECIES: 5-guanidino-2-oxopentanoate decarboxylase [unclassified Crossiella]MCK2238806.1 5-guanidino-2-oxopentanoate decarboxylase [Crossiella sp. S99.2]MCK2251624.1 5-guanidino-2-oxopentanoate decarboxylase [Crossiella sp. S99.1]
MKVTGGQAVVQALAAHGVDTVFGIPGTHNLEIYRHLAAEGVRHVSTRHEQGAAYAADGYARASGRPGVCVVTSGPATLNAAAAIGQAYSDSVPVLLISPGLPLRHPGRGNGYLHEMKDQSAAMHAIAGYSLRVTSVAEIPGAVAEAFAYFRAGRPRPVHLEVPVDVLGEVAEVAVGGPVAVGRVLPEAAVLARVVEVLGAARRPGLLVGGGAKGAAGLVRELAELVGAPVVSTANGKGVLAEGHPLSLGAGVHLPGVVEFVRDCDVLVVLGSELAPSDFWVEPLARPGCLVRVDVDPGQLRVNAAPEVEVVGDVGAVLAELLPRLAGGERGDGAERAAWWRERLREQGRAEGARWLWLLEVLGEALGDGILGADSAMACYYGALTNLPVQRPGGFLYPTGFGTLGYGLPAAIGAAVACPGVRTAALLGDGGVMFTVAELATAAQLGLALPVLVVDNAGYGEIRAEMVEREDPVHAVDLPSPDFAALGRALGCHGVRVADAESLRVELARAFAADRPTVLHLPEELGRA